MMILQFVVAMFATIAFAVLFSAPKMEVIFCGFTGALGWIIYYILTQRGWNGIFACVMATLILTLFARCLAIIRHCPVTIYLVTGIFPLVPGAGIYYTAYYLVNGDKTLFAAKGLETFEIAAAIGFGILLGFALPQELFNRIFAGKRKSGGSH